MRRENDMDFGDTQSGEEDLRVLEFGIRFRNDLQTIIILAEQELRRSGWVKDLARPAPVAAGNPANPKSPAGRDAKLRFPERATMSTDFSIHGITAIVDALTAAGLKVVGVSDVRAEMRRRNRLN